MFCCSGTMITPQQSNLAQTGSSFPPPPEYAQCYTSDRVNGITYPPPLPPPAVQTDFTVFGEEYRLNDEIIRSLPSQGIKQLYPLKYDWKTEMKKLNTSALTAFLDLIEILIRSPDNPERIEKLNDIQTIFINMHHLINEYRPLQARDTLRLMQKLQLEELEKTITRFRKHLTAGREALQEELSMKNVKLLPVPRPSPLSGISLDSDDDCEMPVLEKEKNYPMEEGEHNNSVMELIRRTAAKPSTPNLKGRQRIDKLFLDSS
ncbi:unnamed protein product [Auanema sp. JU1783]|nr:unnamed protein product [Auanema sp. JU1783]